MNQIELIKEIRVISATLPDIYVKRILKLVARTLEKEIRVEVAGLVERQRTHYENGKITGNFMAINKINEILNNS